VKDGRSKRRIWTALIADPYRKLASVALAIGLWYFLDSQINKDYVLPAALRAVNETGRPGTDTTPGNTLEVLLPMKLVAVAAFVDPRTQKNITEVSLKFSGPKYLVDNLQGDRQLTLSAGPFPGRMWENAEVLEFTAASIVRSSRVLHELTIAMDPPIVQVVLEPKQNLQVTLSKDQLELKFRNPQDDERLRGRLRWEHTEFQPEVVNVVGTKRLIDRFQGSVTKPFLAVVEPRNQDRQVSGRVTLNLPADVADLDLDVTPSVTIELVPRQEETSLDIPVWVDDLSLSAQLRGKYEPESRVQRVKIRVSPKVQSMLNAYGNSEQERNQWAAQYLRLAVWIRPREDERTLENVLTVEARLELRGNDDVDPINYGLVDPVPVKLVRKVQ
jgi:hypothetical protein